MPLQPPVITLPRADWAAISRRFNLAPRSIVAPHPESGVDSVFGPNSQLWICDLSMPPKGEQDWRRLSALFSQLAGRSGLIRIGDPARTEPLYNRINPGSQQAWSDGKFFTTGEGWVSGKVAPIVTIGAAAVAGQKTIVLRDLPASLTPAIFSGDLMEIHPNGVAALHGHLYEAYGDAPTDITGKTRVTINPPLRKAVALGDKVVLSNASTVFSPVDDDQGIFDVRAPSIGQTGVRLIEVPEAE